MGMFICPHTLALSFAALMFMHDETQAVELRQVAEAGGL
jgi:hypothetical protein